MGEMQPQIIIERLLARAERLTQAIIRTDEAAVAAALEAERDLVMQAARCIDRLDTGWWFWRRSRIRVPRQIHPPMDSSP